MPSKPPRIRQLLTQNKVLQPLYAQIQQQQQILRQVRQVLPPNAARHGSAAHLNGTVLNLFTDSPVWVSKLRFQTPALLSSLRSQFPAIASINIRCDTPQRSLSERRKLPAAKRSHQASNTVENSAKNTANPALRAALLRLAKALDTD